MHKGKQKGIRSTNKMRTSDDNDDLYMLAIGVFGGFAHSSV